MPSILETMGFELNRRDSNTLRQDVPETVSGFGTVFESIPQSSVSPSQLIPYNFGQSDYDTGTGFWLGMKNGIPKLSIGNSAGNKLTWDGTTLTVPGVSSLGGFSIGSDYIRDSANSFGLSSVVSGGDDIRFWAGDTFTNRATAPFRVTEAGAVTASNITITGGSVAASTLSGTIPQTNLNVADRGWVQTCVFSITDLDTVAWGAGTFTSADGTAYSITGADTGNMSAKTYIYLDIAVSLTAYQTTTTATTAVGVGKVLVAVAQNGAVEPTFTVMQGQGGQNIDASSIVASSITANEIAASTITAGKMSVSQISAISADLGAMTAGSVTVTSGGNTVALAPGSATAIAAGPTGAPTFTVTQAGVMTATGAIVNGSNISNQDKFGDGLDGNLTLTNSFTLSSDKFYQNLILTSSGSYTNNSTVDGKAGKTSASDIWSNFRVGNGNASSNADPTAIVSLISHASTSGRYTEMDRGIINFPTTLVGTTSTATAANLHVWIDSAQDNFAQNISVVKRTVIASVVNGSYDIANWTMTKQASDIDLTGIGTGAYITIPLNAAGLTSLNTTIAGGTDMTFGLVFSCDADNSAPTWVAGTTAQFVFETLEGTHPPYIDVTYTGIPLINTNGYRLFVNNTLSGNGTIQNNGNNGGNGGNGGIFSAPGAGGTAGAVAPGNSVPAGTIGVDGGTGGAGGNGGAGGAGSNGNIGTTGTKSINTTASVAGKDGGHGGDMTAVGGVGGTGGAAGSFSGTILNKVNNYTSAYYLSDSIGSWTNFMVGTGTGSGAGGGGGGYSVVGPYKGSAGGGGGASGGTGGIVWISAKSITFTGILKSKGGNGGNGGNGGEGSLGNGGGGGGGGGGSGGNGGIIIINTSSLAPTYSTDVTGGTRGNKGLKSTTNNTNATDGTDGIAGNSGRVITLIV